MLLSVEIKGGVAALVEHVCANPPEPREPGQSPVAAAAPRKDSLQGTARAAPATAPSTPAQLQQTETSASGLVGKK